MLFIKRMHFTFNVNLPNFIDRRVRVKQNGMHVFVWYDLAQVHPIIHCNNIAYPPQNFSNRLHVDMYI